MLTTITALLLVIPALPLCILIAVLIALIDGRPVCFTQQRIGLNGKPFMLYKFRTMVPTPNTGNEELNPDQPLTRTGPLLRRTGLDELPQLVNVLRGEMSLVGPRPLPAVYGPYLTRQERRRHRVRPGITGPVQTGLGQGGWERKFEVDLWYAERKCFWLDAKLVLRTVVYVASRLVDSGEGEKVVDLREERAGK